MKNVQATILVVLIAAEFSDVLARVCYECYDKIHCQSPSTIICPTDDYGCATAIIDIEPFVTKGCLSDDKGPVKIRGCKKKTKAGVTGKLCGCMNEDLCNNDCLHDSTSCTPEQSMELSMETGGVGDQESTNTVDSADLKTAETGANDALEAGTRVLDDKPLSAIVTTMFSATDSPGDKMIPVLETADESLDKMYILASSATTPWPAFPPPPSQNPLSALDESADTASKVAAINIVTDTESPGSASSGTTTSSTLPVSPGLEKNSTEDKMAQRLFFTVIVTPLFWLTLCILLR